VTTEWLVIKTEEGSEESTVQRFGSSDDVQTHVADLISGGVSAESLLVYNAKAVKFAVAYKPVVNLGGESSSDAGEAADEGAATDGSEAADSSASADLSPQGSQNGVRLSSMFKTD